MMTIISVINLITTLASVQDLRKQEPETIRPLCECLAGWGSAMALDEIATRLWDSDTKKSRVWLEAAAAGGDIAAAGVLGFKLSSSEPKVARAFYDQAAGAGDVHAMFNLALLIEKTDPKAARDWYECAVERGHVKSMNGLGRAMLREKNRERAMELFSAAAESGYAPAMVSLGRACWKNRRERSPSPGIAGRLTAVIRGNVRAGTAHKKRNPEEARRLFEAAVAKGYDRAKRPLKVLDRFSVASSSTPRPPKDFRVTPGDLRDGKVVVGPDGHRFLVKTVGPLKRGVRTRRTVYNVEVHDLTLRNKQVMILVPRPTIMVVGEFETRQEAQHLLKAITQRIHTGDWQPSTAEQDMELDPTRRRR